jgi:Cu+-exporting ATPase
MIAAVSLGEKKTYTEAETSCYHCGLSVVVEEGKSSISIDDKHFCCEGCKMVYEILNANDLCQYYNIEKNAGISLKGRRQEQYAWLDDAGVVEKLTDFTDGKKVKISLYLPQIHCASCIWLVENLYKLSPGILASKVNFLKKEAYITFNAGETTLRKVVEILASIGYAPEINLGTLENEKKKPVSRRLIYQLGVAGFGFGNIMLLSFPEYFGLDATERTFQLLFGYLNILLAIPVAFYSGKDYLTAAWYSLKTRNFGIDIPLALGILVLFFRSAFDIVMGMGAGYMDSLAGLVFFLLIGKWFQQVTYHSISFERDYRSYFPVAITRLLSDRNSPSGFREESVPVNRLEAGDAILVRHKELIPADSILRKGKAHIDYSFVTGEAEPVEKNEGEKIYAGGRQMGDSIELLLTKKVSQSYLTQLWNEDSFQTEKLAGTSRLANRVSRYFTVIILAIAFATLIYWLPKNTVIAFNAFTAVLIIACPCAAALNVPFTLGNTVRQLSKRGFFIKNTNVIEALRSITAVVFDKTGTLTYASGSSMEYEGEALKENEKQWVAALVRQSSHPISRQLAALMPVVSHAVELLDFQEITGQGVSGRVGDHRLKIGSKAFAGQAASSEESATSANVFIEIDGRLKGAFYLHNRYRKSAWEVIHWFMQRGKAFLLSGDNEREREFLRPWFAGNRGVDDNIFFQQSPKDKLNFIKNQQSGGEKVLMIGDGLNDAGALQQSDVGIVIAEDANNFTPACDAILDARQFERLPQFIEFARKSIQVVYAAWILAAIYNVIGLSYAVQGLLSPVVAAILMPASSVTIVAFGVGVSTLLARKIEN